MTILVDYDNLDSYIRRRGVRYAVSRLLDTLGTAHVAGRRNVIFRLYGGWFSYARLSRTAQRIAPQLRQDFPRRMTVVDEAGAHTLLVQVELAWSLTFDPGVAITHTHRQRSVPPQLRCVSTPFPGCVAPSSCRIMGLEPFIREASCPANNCTVVPQMVLTREEQKLVDSMLVVDLVHLAQTTTEPLVVVSADDDLWPGIRFVLLHGTSVIHIIPRHGEITPGTYRDLATSTYTRVVM